jgi:small nuclear ribonucleoprotein F
VRFCARAPRRRVCFLHIAINPFPRAPLPFTLSLQTSPFSLSAGQLVSADSYMNFQLGGAEEWVDGALAGRLGDLLIRCNNVLYVREIVGGGGME